MSDLIAKERMDETRRRTSGASVTSEITMLTDSGYVVYVLDISACIDKGLKSIASGFARRGRL